MRTDNVGEATKITLVPKIKSNLFQGLPFRGELRTYVILFDLTPWKANIAGPGIVIMGGPFDEEHLRTGCFFAEKQRDCRGGRKVIRDYSWLVTGKNLLYTTEVHK